jgi:hypothetical protein
MPLWIKIRMTVDLTALFVLCGLFVLILFRGEISVGLLPFLAGSVVLIIQQIVAALLYYRYLRKAYNKSRWNALTEAASTPQFFFWRDQDFLNAKAEVRRRLRKQGKIL